MAVAPTESDQPTRDRSRLRRWVRPAVLVGVVGLLVIPVITDTDDFPLSTYPMYSRTRSDEVSFVTANGFDSAGDRLTLGLGVIGVSDDPLVVAGELRAAIRAGRSDENCVAILARAERNRSDVVAVEVVTERHDVIDHTAGRASLVDRTVHAECASAELDR